jgi:hypothetical protein
LGRQRSFGQVFLQQPLGHAHGIGHTNRIRTAVAFDDNPVQAQKNGAIMVVGVKMVLEDPSPGARSESRP